MFHGKLTPSATDDGPRLRRPPTRRAPNPDLSVRELDVVRLMHAGLTDSAIGASLGMATNTVKATKAHCYEKLGLTNSGKANRILVALMWERGQIKEPAA